MDPAPAPAVDKGALLQRIAELERKLEEATRRQPANGGWESLANALPQFIWVAESFGVAEFINDYWFEYTGLPQGSLDLANWAKVIHPDDLEQIAVMWQHAVASQRETTFEYRVRRASDGVWRWHFGIHRPELGSQGQVLRWVGIGIDIHDRKEAEAALRASEERFRSIVEASAEGIWIIDVEGRTTFVNATMGEMLGYPPEDIIGHSCFEYIHPEELERGMEGFEKRKAGNDSMPREYRFIRHDGAVRWLSFVGSAMYAADGSMAGVLAMCTDTTDRRAMEERLLQLNSELSAKVKELETLLEVIPIGVAFSYDPQCRTVTLNPAAQRVHGIDPGINPSLTGPHSHALPFEIRRDGKQINAAELPLQLAARSGRMTVGEEYEILRRDGITVPVVCSASPIHDSDGKPRGAIAALLDISERKNMETALRRANAALEQFAYAAAHDLQEPVRNIVLYTQLLSREYGAMLDDRAAGFMKLTVDSARRLQDLIHDLLNYTTAAADGEALLAHDYDTHAALDEVMENLKTAIDTEQAEITADQLPRVAVRHGHMVQILQNLISNSLKYRGPDPPRIHVSAEPEGQAWVITVKDNGRGIDPSQHERIFRVFKRLHGRDVPGTGIGLAICERIVSHYGGRIWVDSAAGSGAAFRFRVPSLNGSFRSVSEA